MNRSDVCLADHGPLWTTFLQSEPTWVSARGLRPSASLQRALADAASGASVAVVWPRWYIPRSRSRWREGTDSACYRALPSPRSPWVVTSPDRRAWRYVRRSILATPPGTSGPMSLLTTVALALLRLPGTWAIMSNLVLPRIEVVRAP